MLAEENYFNFKFTDENIQKHLEDYDPESTAIIMYPHRDQDGFKNDYIDMLNLQMNVGELYRPVIASMRFILPFEKIR